MSEQMQTRPVPYPAGTKAKGWRFELDYEAIQQSDTWALAEEVPMAQPALLMMWLTSWAQIPCGSFPNDPNVIRAKCKVPAKDWKRMSEVLMRGWWLADDGRLYHPTITARVLNMLTCKEGERARKADWRARKDAELKLAEANASSRDAEFVPPLSHGTTEGQTVDSHGSDDTGTGTGTGLGIGTPPPLREEGRPEVSHGTKAGQICKAMRQQGLADGNPSNPTLLALIEAGATESEFVSAAKRAAEEQKGFNYAIGIVTGERKRAAQLVQKIHHGPLPAAGNTSYAQQAADVARTTVPGPAGPDRTLVAIAEDAQRAAPPSAEQREKIRQLLQKKPALAAESDSK